MARHEVADQDTRPAPEAIPAPAFLIGLGPRPALHLLLSLCHLLQPAGARKTDLDLDRPPEPGRRPEPDTRGTRGRLAPPTHPRRTPPRPACLLRARRASHRPRGEMSSDPRRAQSGLGGAHPSAEAAGPECRRGSMSPALLRRKQSCPVLLAHGLAGSCWEGPAATGHVLHGGRSGQEVGPGVLLVSNALEMASWRSRYSGPVPSQRRDTRLPS